jgi:cellulose synthase/poly-beta-1,6-N-acetylglucosamine synthase-like glycosyltransferase
MRRRFYRGFVFSVALRLCVNYRVPIASISLV